MGGYRLYLRCTGKGTPTVVMDASANADSSTWSDVEPSLARVTRVCVYDRAGLGRSDPAGLFPRTSQTMVDELTTLLRVAGVPGPYVLVGHSLAGFNVQLWAREDGGDTVVGVVLIDATPPGLIAVYDSLGIPIPPPDDLVENPEGFDFRASADPNPDGRAVPARTPRRAHPRHRGPGLLEEVWQELQVAQSQLSPKGRLIVARKSGHFIQNDQPRLVFWPSCRSSPGPGTTLLTATPSAPPADGSQLRRHPASAPSLRSVPITVDRRTPRAQLPSTPDLPFVERCHVADGSRRPVCVVRQ